MSMPIQFAGLRVPAMAAPMFIISNPSLVLATCRAGMVGSFPSLNARPVSLLDEWLGRIVGDAAAAPFAVNLIQRPAGAGSGVVREVEGAGDHYVAGRTERCQ